jgi:signal transduction histidine kinase
LFFRNIEQIKLEHEKNLLSARVEIQESTFQQISRDIHDNINLSLTLVKLNLITMNLQNKRSLLEKINASIGLISKAIIDLTDISRCMNSEIIKEQGLIIALQQEIEKLKKLSFFDVYFRLRGNPIFMDAQKELFIFRIMQESFNNILKHARASKVDLCLDYTNTQLNIMISDNGVGFFYDQEHKRGEKATAGLRNMQKRAELLNGSCDVITKFGVGTIINISIPF